MRIVLLTGASSGFGLHTALLLAKQGWKVYAGFRDPGMSGELLGEAEAHGVREQIRPIRLDVTDEGEVREAFRTVESECGRLDALINNAGYAVGGFAEEIPLALWREQFETNVFGVVSVTREALPLMRRTGGGRIVLVSSVSGRIGFPGLGPYAASKHALEGLGESLRLELAIFGIAVSLVEPGAYQTPIWRKSLAQLPGPAPGSPYAPLYERLKPLLDRSAAGGGHPDRVAETIHSVLSARRPKLRYVPGWNERWTIGLKTLLPWSWLEKAALRMLGVKR
jgi:NAD(P)-dependent dehydrogenase (short-subunit alcohol dehydrogenase family)